MGVRADAYRVCWREVLVGVVMERRRMTERKVYVCMRVHGRVAFVFA